MSSLCGTITVSANKLRKAFAIHVYRDIHLEKEIRFQEEHRENFLETEST